MASRQTTRPLRKLAPAVAIGIGALLGIVGCSAGQVAQTAEMPPAVNGNSGQAGQLALRDVQIAYPENGEDYQAGDDAPLTLVIVNTGAADDELVGVTSPAGQVEIIGNPKIPGRSALAVVEPGENPAASTSETTTESSSTETSTETTGSETSGTETSGTETSGTETSGSVEPTSETVSTPETTEPAVVGTVSLVITGLTAELPFGKNVPVTFEFANGGKVTIQVPIASPTTPRPAPTEAAENEH